MNEDFKLLVGLDIESKQAENKVKEFTKKREIVTEIKINGTKAFKHLKTYINEMGEAMQTLSFSDKNGNKTNEEILKVSDSFKVLNTEVTKWTDKQGAIHKVTTEIDNFGNTTQTRVTEINNGLNGITTSTENWIKNTNGAFEKVGDTVTNTITDIDKYKKAQQELIQADRERMAEVTKTTTNTKEMVNGHRALVTTIEEENSVLGKVTTRVSQYKDELGRTITVTDKMDASGKKMQGTMTEISDKAHKMSQSFSDILTKVAKFYLASLPIRAMQTAVTETIQTVKEFDDALTDFKKVSDLSGKSLDNYTKKLGELGKQTARTRKEMVEASTEFVKSGYSEEQSVQLSKIATLFQNIADEEVSTADSASLIISQMKAYGNETEAFANHVVDAINNVSNNMSVSSSDIATGLTKTASAMGALGNDYDHTIALITAGSEIMVHQSSKVAKGLRSIGNNIADLAQKEDTLSFTVQGATKEIQLMDSATGDLKSTYQVLEDIYTSGWEQMTNAEQQSLAITLAKKTQFEVFTSILNNFSGAQKAVGLALESSGSAMKENEAHMQSLSAKLNLLKAEFSEFILGEGGLVKFGKAILDIGIKLLEFANSDIGQTIIQITLLTTTISLLPKALKLITDSNIVSWLSNFVTAMSFAKDSTIGFVGALELANLNPIILGISALVAVVVIAKKAYDKFNVTLEESIENVKELQSEWEDAQSEMDSISERLEIIDKRINEINSKDGVVLTNDGELKELERQRGELERLYKVEQARRDLAKEEAQSKAKETLIKKVENPYSTTEYNLNPTAGEYGQKIVLNDYTSITQAIKDASDEMVIQQGVIDNLNKSKQNGITLSEEEQKQLDESSDAIKKANIYALEQIGYVETLLPNLDKESEEYKQITGIIDYYNEQHDKVFKAEEKEVDKTKELIDTNEEYSDEAEEQTAHLLELAEAHDIDSKELSKMAKSLNITEDALCEYADSMGVSVQQAYDYLKGLEVLNEGFDNLVNIHSQLTQAVEEYNSTGQYSLETLQNLLKLEPQYLALLEEKNGKLQLNEQGFENLANAMIDQAEASLMVKTQSQIADIVLHQFDEDTKSLGQTSTDTSTKLDKLGDFAKESGKKASEGAIGWSKFWFTALQGQGTISTDKAKKEMQQLREETEKEWKSLENLRGQFGKYAEEKTKAKEGGSKASNSEREAEQKLKDEVQKVTDAYNKRISAVKKARDEAVKSVEAQIKALKKERDEVVKGLEAQIKSLKNQKEAREKYWEEQIGKLERENKEREKNIELQEKQEALAKAQQQRLMIFKDGQFQYGQDEEAVSDAQQNLIETEDKLTYEEQKQLMEDLKDAELEWYEQRIEALEDYKDRVKENYDEQIEQLEEYKDLLKEQYDAEIEQLEELRDKEKEALEQKLENEKNHYSESISAIQKYNADLSAEVERLKAIIKSLAEISMPSFVVGGGLGAFSGLSVLKAKSTGDNYVNAYANGRASIGDNEMALVGDNPKYREIVIGSKLNNDVGTMLSLKRGSGVVNANATNTLASLFNGLKGSNIKGIERSVTNNNGNSISIGSITLPQVSNGEEFVNYLQNFAMDMTQASYS